MAHPTDIVARLEAWLDSVPIAHQAWLSTNGAGLIREAATALREMAQEREKILIDGATPKRYDLVTNYRCGSAIEELEPAEDGEWVRWETLLAVHDRIKLEHEAWDKNRIIELHAARQKADTAEQALAEWKEKHERA